MHQLFKLRLNALVNKNAFRLLNSINRGIEKESLRIQPNGRLAQTPHPQHLGSALAHPRITTDYSEALLEFITPVANNMNDSLTCLDEIHRFVYSQLENDELLWVASMPCVLPGEEHIPVAQYGNSNVAKMKTTYRIGLGHRYGRLMQTIAGIHYNFSLPNGFWPLYQDIEKNQDDLTAFKTRSYFSLIRNFRRYFWLLIYLFGSSPAVCHTFLQGRKHQLQPAGKGTLFAPWGTSLRMGNLGYQSDAQASLIVCYNDLETYMKTLSSAIHHPLPEYEKIGVKVNGEYRQLNASLLQIENEFYSSIRPKRTTQSGETPLHALQERGVEYIEVRCIDVAPSQPLGIDPEQIHFLDTFLLFCLVEDSPKTNPDEYYTIQQNQQAIVMQGRAPNLMLSTGSEKKSVKSWGSDLLDKMSDVATLLDQANNTTQYSKALQRQQTKVADPQATPSAQALSMMQEFNNSYFTMAMHYAIQHKQFFLSRPLASDRLDFYEQLAEQSLQKQLDIEASDKLTFDAYLDAYYSQ